MDDFKKTVAQNMINLRTAAGMTQAQLGEKLSYSDKSISKWERGDALPDVFVMKKMAALFSVSVDYMLEDHGENNFPAHVPLYTKYSRNMVTLVCVAAIWAVALLAFVIVWIIGDIQWLIFAYTLPVSLVCWLIFNSLWARGVKNSYIIMGIIISIIFAVYMSFLQNNWWQLFLLIIPSAVIVFFSTKIKKNSHN